MPRPPAKRTRIFAFPYPDLLFDARLDAIRAEPPRVRRRAVAQDIVLDLALLQHDGAPEVATVDGRPWERVRGRYVPHRLRFSGAEWVSRTGPFAEFDALPGDADARRIFRIVHLRTADRGERFFVVTHAVVAGDCVLRAAGYALEPREGEPEPVDLLRRWSPTPPPAPGLLPHPAALHARYAGDPIAIRLGRRTYRTRLFIGGFRQQGRERPAVDHVVNLSGFDNAWAFAHGRHAADRYAPKGEMALCMSADELLDEALWVAEALRAGRRVLVHCAAGINRSSTVCCAALMLLEGLAAEQALARVRERHPEADPDPYHWFVLRRLHELAAQAGQAGGGRAERELAGVAAVALAGRA